jgi:hypothetical protein
VRGLISEFLLLGTAKNKVKLREQIRAMAIQQSR